MLWLKSELLHPVDKGGKIRTYEMLKYLKDHFDISYLAFTTEDDQKDAVELATEYCHELIEIPWREEKKFSVRFYRDLALNLFSRLPYAVQKYRSGAMERAIGLELNRHRYDIVVCDFLVPAINLPSITNTPTILFQHNVESMIWQRHYERAATVIQRAYMRGQWLKMRRYEQQVCRRFDSVIAVSANDREVMRTGFKLDNVYEVPTGIDTGYFCPTEAVTDPANLVFTGSMDWLPNEDGILYFAESILPLISRSVPEVSLTVVGRNPTRRIKALGDSNPQIKVTGRVDDVRPYMSRAGAYIVPLRIGGGTRLKVYEAMSMAMPLISTSIGAEGLPLEDGKVALLADNPDSFAKAVIRVLTDRKFADQMGRDARRFVTENFGWRRAAERFAEICRQAAERGSVRSRSHVA